MVSGLRNVVPKSESSVLGLVMRAVVSTTTVVGEEKSSWHQGRFAKSGCCAESVADMATKAKRGLAVPSEVVPTSESIDARKISSRVRSGKLAGVRVAS